MPAAQRSRQRAPQIPSYLDPEPTEHFSFRVTLVLFKVWPRRRQSEDHTATLQWSRRTKVSLTALHLRQVPLATHRRLKSAARNKQCKAEKHLHVDLSPVQAQSESSETARARAARLLSHILWSRLHSLQLQQCRFLSIVICMVGRHFHPTCKNRCSNITAAVPPRCLPERQNTTADSIEPSDRLTSALAKVR